MIRPLQTSTRSRFTPTSQAVPKPLPKSDLGSRHIIHPQGKHQWERNFVLIDLLPYQFLPCLKQVSLSDLGFPLAEGSRH